MSSAQLSRHAAAIKGKTGNPMQIPFTKWLRANPRIIAYGIGILVGIVVLSVVLRRIIVLDEEPSLRTFAIIHFSGYLFFIISPVELLFVNMPDLRANMWDMVGLAVGTALLAQAFDYGIGDTFSRFVIHRIIGERRYKKYLGRINRYGDVTIFLFCFLPLSSPIVVLVAGMIQYGLLRILFISSIGLTAKYIVLAYIFG